VDFENSSEDTQHDFSKCGKYIYTYANNLIQKYDSIWTTISQQESPVPYQEGMSMAIYGGVIYFVGGYYCSDVLSNSFYAFIISKCTWLVLSPMSKARSYPTAAVVNGVLYVIGGFDHSGPDTPPNYCFSAKLANVETYPLPSVPGSTTAANQ